MILALISTGFTIGLLYFLLVAPYLLARGMFMLEYGYCDGSDRIKCMIPFYNLYIAEKLYDKNRFPIIMISSSSTFVLAVVRIVMMFIFPEYVFAAIIVVIVFSVCAIVFWVSSSIFVYKLIDKTDYVYGLKKTVSIIAFPLGEFYIGNYLATAIRNEVKSREAI